ncbi:unnamed protein product [Meloidogyne enterolobii]|uniref:Uncharacterized protein n=1 Tax=Meloidogyne enterolobii TaxID=390850 RepID=A0ACB1A4J0_MELEN
MKIYTKNKRVDLCSTLKIKGFKKAFGKFTYHRAERYRDLNKFFANIKGHAYSVAKRRSCSYNIFLFRAFLALAQVLNESFKKSNSAKEQIKNAIDEADNLISIRKNGRANSEKIFKVYHKILVPNLKEYLNVQVDLKGKSVRFETSWKNRTRTHRKEVDLKMKNVLDEDMSDKEGDEEDMTEEDMTEEEDNEEGDEEKSEEKDEENVHMEEVKNSEDEENKNGEGEVKEEIGGEEENVEDSENTSGSIFELFKYQQKSDSGRSIGTVMLGKNEEPEVNSHVDK